MRRHFLLAILLGVLTATSLMGAVEDGFYVVSSDATAVPIQTLKGQTIHLGDVIPVADTEVFLWSQVNDNSRYNLEVTSEAPFPGRFPHVALVLDGRCLEISGGGHGGDKEGKMHYFLHADVSDPAFIAKITDHYHITPQDRHHPGHQFTTIFSTDLQGYSLAKPIQVTLRITNCGTAPFAFRNPSFDIQDNGDFSFAAFWWKGKSFWKGNEWIGLAGNPRPESVLIGFLQATQILKPGETFSLPVDLKKYFTFTQTGKYRFRGSYYLEIMNPESRRLIWDDFATGDFSLEIK